jgi:hypothetical protein
MCLQEFVFNQQRTGTSTLSRHLHQKHIKVYRKREILKITHLKDQKTLFNFQMKGGAITKKEEKSNITKCVLILCRSRHILPLQFYEDPIICDGFNINAISRKVVRSEIQNISNNLRTIIFESKRGQWATLVLDGWKNTVTGDKHISLLLFFCDEPNKPVFVKSYTIQTCTAENIKDLVINTLTFLALYEIVVIATVTDNAPNMISAMKIVSDIQPTILPLRCSSHVLNIILKDFINDIPFLKSAFNVLNFHVELGIVSRYVVTRWNSVFDKMCELVVKLNQNESSCMEHVEKLNSAINALKPLIDVLNLSQMDGTSWESMHNSMKSLIKIYNDTGRDSMIGIIKKRIHLFENPITRFIEFLSNGKDLNESDSKSLIKWTNALRIPEFEEYLADYVLCGRKNLSKKCELFYKYKILKIAVSEAAVERCFGIHKKIHSDIRSTLKNDIVEDILFIRYNYNERINTGSEFDNETETSCIVPLFDE